jgi:hypothetical protein
MQYLQTVAQDRTLYESYHAWRYQPLPPHFWTKFNMTHTHNVCRTCRWTYAKQHGLGWDHVRQDIVDLHIPRHVCRDTDEKDGMMMVWPVRERWFLQQEVEERAVLSSPPLVPVMSCPDVETEPWEDHVQVAQYWERTIHEHDGVIDLHVQPIHHHYPTDYEESSKADDEEARTSGDQTHQEEVFQNPVVVLELVLPFEDTNDPTLEFRHIEAGHLQWQNATSRITVLIQPADTTPIKRFSSHPYSVIHIQHPMAIRILVEDVDTFHVGAKEHMSYFGQIMKDDWENPIEIVMV